MAQPKDLSGSQSRDGAHAQKAVQMTELGNLASATIAVEELLSQATFPLETVDAQSAREMGAQALTHIQDYVRPRLEATQAPVLAVIGGSTGAGKSTLVNSLLGERVTLPGALRPTTRNPVLVHHPDDEEWFATQRVLPSLPREHSQQHDSEPESAESGGARKELRLVPSEALPRGLALIDSPDVDSMVDSNRELAHQLLGAADLWIFLTTAARYADAVPWAALKSAAARQTEIAIVVDRVDPQALEVVHDLRAMLDANDLAEAPLFVIEEQPLQDGLLPAQATDHVRSWLSWLMLAPGARDRVVTGTRTGAIETLARTIEQLAVHTETQIRARDTLNAVVTEAYFRAEKNITAATSDGTMLRGEVLARWQDYVGTGEFMRGFEEKIAAARDKISAYFRGKTAAPKVQRAVGDSLFAVVKDHCDQAAEAVFSAWHTNVAGQSLTLEPSLAFSSENLPEKLAYEIRQWQATVLGLVSEQGAPKRSRARVLALGTNGVGVALMVAALATTGGLTGAEIGIAGGTAIVAQRLLESIFGEDAVRQLAAEAQRDLNQRIDTVLAAEQARYTNKLDSLELHEQLAQQLRSAARTLHAGIAQVQRESAPAQGRQNQRGSYQDGVYQPSHGEREETTQLAASSGMWFGGAIDSAAAMGLGTDFYTGAVLYGSAGTGEQQSGGQYQGEHHPDDPHPAPGRGGQRLAKKRAQHDGKTWWQRLRASRGDGTQA